MKEQTTASTFDFNYIMKICLLYGKILQESNASNEMIEANIQKIARHLHLADNELSTYNAQTSFTIINRHDNSVKMIPVKHSAYNFEKLMRVDDLLDQFLNDQIRPDDFLKSLHDINKHTYSFSKWTQILSAATVSGSMNVIINGLNSGTIYAFILGFIGYWFYTSMQNRVGIKIFSILAYSSFICLLIVFLSRLSIVKEPYSILFSCIMPLLTGTTFVNSIKAMMNGNFITGMTQAMDALSTALMLGFPAAIIFSSLL
ncbi:threonine/serine exporter family protein [Enterococcus sp. LJL98]